MRLLAPVTLALLLLAGCATDRDASDAQRLLDQAGQANRQATTDVVFTMQVTGATIVPGRCFDGATSFGDECHVLDVAIDLTDAKRDLDLWHDWKGITQDGLGVANFAKGGDSATAGRVAQVQMKFDLEAGTADRLVELQHRGSWGPTITTAMVPAY